MEYCLNTLTKKLKLSYDNFNLTLQDLIDVLNLIGFEVDDINIEKPNLINYSEINLLIKLPSNRDDLTIERNFIKELSTIFLLKLDQNWRSLKFSYLNLLKKKYVHYLKYEQKEIISPYPEILSYLIKLKNLNLKSSPNWVQLKLKRYGKSVNNNINDITELVNLEWGQSFNILDNDNCIWNIEDSLRIETLTNSEDFKSINQMKQSLQPGTIVLKLDNQIISVLGLNSSISNDNSDTVDRINPKNNLDKNKSVYLQAFFYNIYNNDLSLNYMKNKISLKFLRKESFENFRFAFQRLLTLIELIYEPVIDPVIYSTKNNNLAIENQKIIALKINSLYSFLNQSDVNLNIFENAGLKIVCRTPKICYLSVPTCRRDLEREIDLIEEYARFVGYKNFSEVSPISNKTYSSKANDNIEFIKQFFINNGFHEVLSNSIDDLKKSKKYSILISNPLNSELNALRTDISSSLLNIFEENIRTNLQSYKFFEIGRIFKILDKKALEIERISGIFQLEKIKKNQNNTIEWFEAKGILERFLVDFGYIDIQFEKINTDFTNYHLTKSVFLKSGNKVLGIFGQINPKFTFLNSLKYSTYLFELNLTYFGSERFYKSRNETYVENSKYPSIIKDLSFFVDKHKNFFDLKDLLMKSSKFLKNFDFFDLFFDSSMNGKLKIGIRLEFKSNLETLTNEFVEKEISNIKSILINNFEVEFY